MQIIIKHNIILYNFFYEEEFIMIIILFNLLACVKYISVLLYIISIKFKFNTIPRIHCKVCFKSYFYIDCLIYFILFFCKLYKKESSVFLFRYRWTSHQTKCLIFYLINIRQKQEEYIFLLKLEFFSRLRPMLVSKKTHGKTKLTCQTCFFFHFNPRI